MFYHLGELDDALSYALGAGTLFDINEQSEYVQTLLGKTISNLQALFFLLHMLDRFLTNVPSPIKDGVVLAQPAAWICIQLLAVRRPRTKTHPKLIHASRPLWNGCSRGTAPLSLGWGTSVLA